MKLTQRVSLVWLWLQLVLCIAVVSGSRHLRQGRRVISRKLIDEVEEVDDLYHCQKDKKQDDDTVECDRDTMQWNLDALDPNFPPERCDVNKVYTLEDIRNDLDDWDEPCILWQIMFGQLQGLTQEPSSSPTLHTQTQQPTSQWLALLNDQTTDSSTHASTTSPSPPPITQPPASFINLNLTLSSTDAQNNTTSPPSQIDLTTTTTTTTTTTDQPTSPIASVPSQNYASPVTSTPTALLHSLLPNQPAAAPIAPTSDLPATVFAPTPFAPTISSPEAPTSFIATNTSVPADLVPTFLSPSPSPSPASAAPVFTLPVTPAPNTPAPITSAPVTTAPSLLPSIVPSGTPTLQPSITPTDLPTVLPSTSPSTTPSLTPTLSVKPSIQPTSFPSETHFPTAVPSIAPSINLVTKPSRRLSEFSITFDSEMKLSTSDVMQFASSYLRSYFERNLYLTVLNVDLKSPSETFVSIDFSGRAIFAEGSVLPTRPTLDGLVVEALESENFKRVLSEHTAIRIDAVYLELYQAWENGSDPFARTTNGADAQNGGNNKLSMILIFAGVAAFSLSVGLFGYYFIGGSRKTTDETEDHMAELKKTVSNDTPQTLSNGPSNDDEDNPNDDLIPDCESDMTSLYTYNHKGLDDSSIHSTPSFLYNMNDTSALGGSVDGSGEWTEFGSNGSNPIDELHNIASKYKEMAKEEKQDEELFSTDVSTIENESNIEDSVFTATSSHIQGSCEVKKKQIEYGDKFGYLFEESDDDHADEEKKQDDELLFITTVKPQDDDCSGIDDVLPVQEPQTEQIDHTLLPPASMQSGQERPLNDIMMSTDAIQGQKNLLSEADDEALFPKENSKNDGEKTEGDDSASVKGNTLQGDAETIAESSVATAALLSTPFQPKSATDPLNIGVAEEEVPVTEHDGCNSNAVPSATDYYESPADIANERRNLKDMASVDLLAFGNEERLTELLPDN